MSDKFLKEIGKVHATLVEAKLVKAVKFNADFDKAKVQFNKSLEGIDVGAKVEGHEDATAVYDKAIDLYEKLNPEGSEPESPAQEVPAKETAAASRASAKAVKAAKPKGKGNTEALAKARANVKRDVFGFPEGSNAFMMGKMLLRKNGCTMKEVTEADWNGNSQTMYNPFRKLVDKGLAKKDGDRLIATDKARKAS